MTSGTGQNILLSEVVEAIAPHGAGVEVQTSKGLHLADHVIVTLPLGVLKSGDVGFGAALDPARQAGRLDASLGKGQRGLDSGQSRFLIQKDRFRRGKARA